MSIGCRACGAPLEPFMSFGKMPLANGFLTEEQIPKESFYELAPAVCGVCSLFQIMEQPMPDRMFHSQYPFYTSNSLHMQKHFEAFANTIKGRNPKFVVELGCNDGTMLKHFIGTPHLGIEPAQNVSRVAVERGCNVWNKFFDNELAKDIVCVYDEADVVAAANVVCHVANLPDLAAGVRRLLKPDGLFIFEEPYLPAMINRCSFDQIYDEHVFLFSVTSVLKAFSKHGLYLVDCAPQWAHGGSMRYYLSPLAGPISRDMDDHLQREKVHGLTDRKTYDILKSAINTKARILRETVAGLRGKRIAGYGATSKSTTVTVYCGLGPNEIEYISDTTPIKQGKLSPGTHIPVRPYEVFQRDPPDVALLFAWNHSEEIYAKEKEFKGKWLNYVPAVTCA